MARSAPRLPWPLVAEIRKLAGQWLGAHSAAGANLRFDVASVRPDGRANPNQLMAKPGMAEGTLGLVRSEDIYQGEQDNIIGSFNRLDRGATYVDHHVFFCVRNERAGLNHLPALISALRS